MNSTEFVSEKQKKAWKISEFHRHTIMKKLGLENFYIKVVTVTFIYESKFTWERVHKFTMCVQKEINDEKLLKIRQFGPILWLHSNAQCLQIGCKTAPQLFKNKNAYTQKHLKTHDRNWSIWLCAFAAF